MRRHLSELSLEARAVVMATGSTHFSLSVPGRDVIVLVQHKARKESSVDKKFALYQNYFMVRGKSTPIARALLSVEPAHAQTHTC